MRKIILAASTAAMTLVSIPAGAGEAEDNAIKFRQRVMGAVAASVGGIAAAAKGDEAMQAIAADLAALLAAATDYDITSAAFAMNTAGLSEARTTALPKVWDDPGDFQAGLRKLAEQTAGLAALGAITMDDLKPLFDTCKACHDDYREK